MDDLLVAMIIAGVGLSGAYLRAEFVLHLRFKAAERRKGLVQRELYNTQVYLQQNELPVHARTDSGKCFPGDAGFRPRFTHLLTEPQTKLNFPILGS